MGELRRRQYSSSSEGIVSCESEVPISSAKKSSTVVERLAVDVEESWVSVGRAGTGGMSMVFVGEAVFQINPGRGPEGILELFDEASPVRGA